MLTDYSTQIRSEIEEDVRGLIRDLRSWEPDTGEVVGDTPPPSYVEIGYIANSHHGYPLFKDGDEIAGLPVRIDMDSWNKVSVVAEDVLVEEEGYLNEDGDYEHGDTYEEDAVVSVYR